jgi:hypothetical protein
MPSASRPASHLCPNSGDPRPQQSLFHGRARVLVSSVGALQGQTARGRGIATHPPTIPASVLDHGPDDGDGGVSRLRMVIRYAAAKFGATGRKIRAGCDTACGGEIMAWVGREGLELYGGSCADDGVNESLYSNHSFRTCMRCQEALL